MFLKLGNAYAATLLVTDINGNRVLNDTPVLIVKDAHSNRYFNGITWQTNQCFIVMPHVDNGVYSKQVTIDESGVYQLTMRSDTYSISKSETIEVYDNNLMRYDWLVGSNFIVKYTGQNATENVQAKIVKDLDGTFWDGSAWIDTEIYISVPFLTDNVYAYTFIPDTESEYSISVVSGENELFYILNVTQTADNIAPVFVDHASFISLDGTDSTTVNEKGELLFGVQVSVFDLATKLVVAKTASNSSGEWSLLLKPGTYYFMFEKDGYMSIGFERTVM